MCDVEILVGFGVPWLTETNLCSHGDSPTRALEPQDVTRGKDQRRLGLCRRYCNHDHRHYTERLPGFKRKFGPSQHDLAYVGTYDLK